MFLRTLSLLSILAVASAADLLNVSYDVAREVSKDVNPAFAATPAGAGANIKDRKSVV